MAEVLIIIAFGAFATALFQIIAYFLGSGQRSAHLERLSTLRAKGMVETSESLVAMKGVLDEVLREIDRKNRLSSWLQNFFWFAIGSAISLFSSELRALIGLQ